MYLFSELKDIVRSLNKVKESLKDDELKEIERINKKLQSIIHYYEDDGK